MAKQEIQREAFSVKGIEERLDIMTKLLASLVGADLPVAERAPLLARAGMDRNAIAAVCDASAAAVSVRLSEAKHRPKRRSARKRAKES